MAPFEIEVIEESRIDSRPEDFNTAVHRVSEHPALYEEALKPFDLGATTFDKWLPLISKSRGITGKTEKILVPNHVVRELSDAVKVFRNTGRASRSVIDELAAEPPFSGLPIFDGRKWFFRADDVSAKDAPGAEDPITDVRQLLGLLTTSWRMNGAYARHKGGDFTLHLLPWDELADTRSEFRVFVAPAESITQSRVTAISQYSWWRPILPEMERRIPEVVAAAEEMLSKIKSFRELSLPLSQGFTFDLQLREHGAELIELNGFGALQATGACLFNWVSDRHILYDEDDADGKVIVRVCHS